MPLGLSDRQPARGTTPFAYATPFSNAPLQERPVRAGSSAPAAVQDGLDDDSDFDFQICESGSDDMYDDDDESAGIVEMVVQDHTNTNQGSQGWQLPEDEPWPGIEDPNNVSDGENIDPLQADRHSNASSQPSEYPSTQSAWPNGDTSGFHIHEDEENAS